MANSTQQTEAASRQEGSYLVFIVIKIDHQVHYAWKQAL
jgi:hypothetical protein